MIWPFLRIAIGAVFLVSSLSKLLGAYQNFLYVVQAYELLPSWAELAAALVLPWVELIAGCFTLLGLWTPWALRLSMVLFGLFVVVTGQALLRGLPLENCGCFGEWVHLKPQAVILMDSAGLLLTVLLLRHVSRAKTFSLDNHFDRV